MQLHWLLKPILWVGPTFASASWIWCWKVRWRWTPRDAAPAAGGWSRQRRLVAPAARRRPPSRGNWSTCECFGRTSSAIIKKKTKKKTHFQDRSGSLLSFCTNSFAIFQDRSGSFRIAQVSAIVSNRLVRNFSGLFRIVKDLLGSFRVFQDRLGSLRIIQISAIVLNKLVCNFSGSFRIFQDLIPFHSHSFQYPFYKTFWTCATFHVDHCTMWSSWTYWFVSAMPATPFFYNFSPASIK